MTSTLHEFDLNYTVITDLIPTIVIFEKTLHYHLLSMTA
jgi:hypothetical protein